MIALQHNSIRLKFFKNGCTNSKIILIQYVQRCKLFVVWDETRRNSNISSHILEIIKSSPNINIDIHVHPDKCKFRGSFTRFYRGFVGVSWWFHGVSWSFTGFLGVSQGFLEVLWGSARFLAVSLDYVAAILACNYKFCGSFATAPLDSK